MLVGPGGKEKNQPNKLHTVSWKEMKFQDILCLVIAVNLIDIE